MINRLNLSRINFYYSITLYSGMQAFFAFFSKTFFQSRFSAENSVSRGTVRRKRRVAPQTKRAFGT